MICTQQKKKTFYQNLLKLSLLIWDGQFQKVFTEKIFSRSGLFLNHLVTVEGGVIDSDYRGIVKVILFNHSDQPFSVKIGHRIAQVVFMEKFNVRFEMVQSRDILKKTDRNEGDFGSSGNNWWMTFSFLILADKSKKKNK